MGAKEAGAAGVRSKVNRAEVALKDTLAERAFLCDDGADGGQKGGDVRNSGTGGKGRIIRSYNHCRRHYHLPHLLLLKKKRKYRRRQSGGGRTNRSVAQICLHRGL